MNASLGIHHITAIASHPKSCIDFYCGVLGLRLVKRSVNQDQVDTYHLFFGDTTGEPGLDLTFFTFQPVRAGVRGAGVVTLISLAVPTDSLGYWEQRFDSLKVQHEAVETRFGRKRMIFFDQDGQRLELVELGAQDYDQAITQVWTEQIEAHYAIGAFHSAGLTVVRRQEITPVLEEVLGFEKLEEGARLSLYQVGDAERGGYLEVEEQPSAAGALSGAGSVHHIAFRVRDEAHQLELREKVAALGLHPTEVIDRFYFKSVYFRTEAGILFELATDGPGFTADESAAHLGEKLALPPFLEPHRREITQLLPPI